MKELQFTMYEVFGYLLPGAVFCAGVGVLFWAIFFPHAVVQFDLKTVEIWATFLALAYVGGHVAQALGNKAVRRYQSAEEKVITDPNAFPAHLVKACREKAAKLCKCSDEPDPTPPAGGEPFADLPPLWLYRFCDDAVIRSGKIGEREVYTYREGFYRGTFVGCVVLTIALLALALRLWFWTDDHKATIGMVELTGWRLVYFAVFTGISARYLWNRYWRFAEYRVTHALLGFLTIREKAEEKKNDAKKGTTN